MFEPIVTERLVVRPAVPADVDALQQRRSEPDVARFQGWDLPYPTERAAELLAGAAKMEGPSDGEWWMATVQTADGEIVGDFAVHLTSGGRCAEIGVTFASRHWGRGYAIEAGTALVAALFDRLDVELISAMTHPDNAPAARLVEKLGMEYEGRTRQSHWDGSGTVSDDLLYGMTRESWRAWTERPRGRPDRVELVEITPETAREIEKLATHRSQRQFVATVLQSYGDALFPQVVDGGRAVPWLRAVEADGDPAGFVMLAEVTDHHPQPYLWRLLVDRRHQRRGIGVSILDLVVAEVLRWGAERLEVSWTEGRGSPRPFYERYGFVPTGRVVDGETEAALDLRP